MGEGKGINLNVSRGSRDGRGVFYGVETVNPAHWRDALPQRLGEIRTAPKGREPERGSIRFSRDLVLTSDRGHRRPHRRRHARRVLRGHGHLRHHRRRCARSWDALR